MIEHPRVIIGVNSQRLKAIKAVKEALLCGLVDAKRIVEEAPVTVYPEIWGPTAAHVEVVLETDDISFLVGCGSEPRLDPFECASCGRPPRTWIDAEMFLDPEHIEVFGGRLLCPECWKSPMELVLPQIEKRVRPASRWDLLMDRCETCLT